MATDVARSQVTAVYVEIIRDQATWQNKDPNEVLAKVTVHEIGHQFNIANVAEEHRGTAGQNGQNIMSTGGVWQIPLASFYADPEDIAFLRLQHKSLGLRV